MVEHADPKDKIIYLKRYQFKLRRYFDTPDIIDHCSMSATNPEHAANIASRPAKGANHGHKSPKAGTKPRSRTAGKLIKRANKIIALLEKDSPFFGSGDEANRLPTFNEKEVVHGQKLGEGEFSNVCEIVEFRVEETCSCIFHGGGISCTESSSAHTSTPGTEEQMQQNQSANDCGPNSIEGMVTFQDLSLLGMGAGGEYSAEVAPKAQNEDRGFMKDHCFRSGSARYAIKQLKSRRTPEELSEAIIDLAMEAKFLARLSHTNIIKMRGTGGTPCHPEYFLVLDRLYDTLEERLDKWAVEKKRLSGVMGIIGKKRLELRHLFSDRLIAALDIARALKYLHEKNIIFRDLKPENIGFDVRGDAKIFDFGLAKELLPRDRVGPDEYKASGLTGSRRCKRLIGLWPCHYKHCFVP
jgi:serine/threonine protein kinase